MDNKQTGWVPDFPDVKDYTLRSKQVLKALQPIESAQIIGSLESQKGSVIDLLGQIVKTTKNLNPERKKVEELYQKLQEGMGNEVLLLEAELLEPNEQSGGLTGFSFDIERISSEIFDSVVKNVFQISSSKILELKEQGECRRLIQVIYPIVNVIAQIITPIGGHGNLTKTVKDKGIKYFKSLLEPESENSSEQKILESLIQEIQELKKATESKPNSLRSSFQSISSWKSNNQYFEYLVCSAILKAKEQLIGMQALQERDNKAIDSEIFDTLNKIDDDLEKEFNNALETRKLPFGEALKFERKNDECVEIKSYEWEQGKPVTLEFWMKVNEDEVESTGCVLGCVFTAMDERLENRDGAGVFSFFDVFFNSENLGLVWRYTEQFDQWLFADYSLYLNQWTHVALVVEEKKDKYDKYMSIYLNGVLVEQCSKEPGEQNSKPKDPDDASASIKAILKIGESYKGQMAEFCIWNQEARTQEDIRNDMFLMFKESKEELTNYWSLNKVTDEVTFKNERNPNNKSEFKGGNKPNIVPIEQLLLYKWIIKNEKNKVEGLVNKQQTRLYIKPSQEEPNGNGEKNKNNSLQFLILRKHLDKITAKGVEDLENANNLSGLAVLPDFIDLSFWCSEIEDQGSLNSCTASAAIALMEYFQKKSFGKYIDGSRLFLYKATRNLMQIEGNVGTSIRNTMKAMALFGVPPEEYWPYDEAKVNVEPESFCYAFAQSYQALKYFRLDPAGITNEVLLAQIKAILVSGFPCVFGFTLYSSIYDDSNPKGYIPYPHGRDKAEGGHSVVAVGYDDYKVIKNADDKETTGALLIRNSWGSRWGEGGYGWLPYEYVLKGLTADWWSLLSSEWFDTETFGLGGKDWTDNLGACLPNGKGC